MSEEQPTKKRGRPRTDPRWIEEDRGFATPCRIWQLSRDRGGYGKENINGIWKLAHRRAYEERHGPIPEGLQIDHICGQRDCGNTDHLEAVTPAENVRRGSRTKLTRESVDEIRRTKGSQSEIAARFGVTQGHISRIRRGQCWRD